MLPNHFKKERVKKKQFEVVGINLSGVVTFLLQGIRPMKWWEVEKAKKAVGITVTVWVMLLVILAVIIYFEKMLKGG